MKIGVVTWFYDDNYGTKLQAIALQTYLKTINHNVELVNFYPPLPKQNIKSLKTRVFNKLKKICLSFFIKKYADDIKIHKEKMNGVIQKYCKVSRLIQNDNDYISTCNSYDLLIFGSDQIWNPNWHHKYYYGNFDQIKTIKVAYAPSIGVAKMTNIQEKVFVESVKNFEKILLREKFSSDYLSKLMGRTIYTVVDPTFLLAKEEWIRLFRIKIDNSKKYVLSYFLGENSNHKKAARKFAAQYGLELVSIPTKDSTFFNNGKVIPNCGVEDFLSLILNSEVVITDSYHGTIFSLIFNKQFYVFKRFNDAKKTSQNIRIIDLLKTYEITNRIQEYNQSFIVERANIDFDIINKLILDNENISKKILFEMFTQIEDN